MLKGLGRIVVDPHTFDLRPGKEFGGLKTIRITYYESVPFNSWDTRHSGRGSLTHYLFYLLGRCDFIYVAEKE